MSFMNQVSTKSKDLTQKAKDMTDQTKIKNLIKGEQEKITSLYEAIGKIYYENETDNLREPYADIVKTIKISMDKIKEYEEKIKSIKSRYVCPNCGATVSSSTQFCKNCGSKISNFS